MGSEVDQLLGGVPTTPGSSEVVTHLLAPILRRRRLLAPDPADVVANLARWASRFPPDALRAAAYRVLEERHSAVTEENIVAALRSVHKDVGIAPPLDRPAAPRVAADGLMSIHENEHPEAFAAWIAFHKALEAEGKPNGLKEAEKLRFVRQFSLFPRSHPTGRPAVPSDVTVH